MSLSFREEAAIRVYAVQISLHPNNANAILSTIASQALADECRASWGHTWEGHYGEFDKQEQSYRTEWTCTRCGAHSKEKPE